MDGGTEPARCCMYVCMSCLMSVSECVQSECVHTYVHMQSMERQTDTQGTTAESHTQHTQHTSLPLLYMYITYARIRTYKATCLPAVQRATTPQVCALLHSSAQTDAYPISGGRGLRHRIWGLWRLSSSAFLSSRPSVHIITSQMHRYGNCIKNPHTEV